MTALTISDSTVSVMNDLDAGTAFNTSLVTDLGTLSTSFSGVAAAQSSYQSAMGAFSPTMLNFGAISGATDTTPLAASDFTVIDFGTDATTGDPIVPNAATTTALTGLPKGMLSLLQSHVTSQFANLTDNMSLFASSQSVANALGTSTGCGSLTDHFGSIISQGQDVTSGLQASQQSMTSGLPAVQQAKTAAQSAITASDTNILSMLSGKISPTVLAQAVPGTGLYDQLDGMIAAGSFTGTTADAASLKNTVAASLPSTVSNFYAQKATVNTAAASIASQQSTIFNMVGNELTTITDATTTLRKLGTANAVQSLFKNNECIQALMGFVATDSFIANLGIS